MIVLVIFNLLLLACTNSATISQFEISLAVKMVLNHEQAEEATVGIIQRRNIGNDHQVFRYGECTKNQASAINLKAFDGCLEFMPGGEPGTIEALSCAACNCHRNFHRKEPVVNNHDTNRFEYHMTSSQPSGSRTNLEPGGSSRRRVRTKFTQDQKDRMLEFANGLGWRVRSGTEGRVHHFCATIGVHINVFKVWMRNNKYTRPAY